MQGTLGFDPWSRKSPHVAGQLSQLLQLLKPCTPKARHFTRETTAQKPCCPQLKGRALGITPEGTLKAKGRRNYGRRPELTVSLNPPSGYPFSPLQYHQFNLNMDSKGTERTPSVLAQRMRIGTPNTERKYENPTPFLVFFPLPLEPLPIMWCPQGDWNERLWELPSEQGVLIFPSLRRSPRQWWEYKIEQGNYFHSFPTQRREKTSLRNLKTQKESLGEEFRGRLWDT